MSKVRALPTSTKPASPQVQSKLKGLVPLLAMVKIRVTVFGSLRRSWLTARVMPGRSAWSLEATTGAGAGWPAVVVALAWAAWAWAGLPLPRLHPAASAATRTRLRNRTGERGADRHTLLAELRIRRVSLSRADNAAVFIQPREGRDPGNRELRAQHGRTGNLEMSTERAQFPSDYAAAPEQWGRREEGG